MMAVKNLPGTLLDFTGQVLNKFLMELEEAGFVDEGLDAFISWAKAVGTTRKVLDALLSDYSTFDWPYSYAKGGLIPGGLGKAIAAVVHGGEYVIPAQQVSGISDFLKQFSTGFSRLAVPPSLASPLAGATNAGDMVFDNTIYLGSKVLYHEMRRVNGMEEKRRTGSTVGTRAWRRG